MKSVHTIELLYHGIPLRYTNPDFATTNTYVGQANVETLLDLVGKENVLSYYALSDLDSVATESFQELSEFAYTKNAFPLVLRETVPLILKRNYADRVTALYLLEEGSCAELSKTDPGFIPEYMKHDFFYLLGDHDYPLIDEYAYNLLIADEQYKYLEDILADEILSLIEDENVQDWAYYDKDTVVEILDDLCAHFGEYPEEEPSGDRMYFRPSRAYERKAIQEITNRYLEGIEAST